MFQILNSQFCSFFLCGNSCLLIPPDDLIVFIKHLLKSLSVHELALAQEGPEEGLLTGGIGFFDSQSNAAAIIDTPMKML